MVISKRLAYLLGVGVPLTVIFGITSIPFFWILGCFFTCWLDWLLAPDPKQLLFERELPSQIANGKQATCKLTLVNTSRRIARWELRDLWDANVTITPARTSGITMPGNNEILTFELLPNRRGRRRTTGIALRCWGPLRICGKQKSLAVYDYLQVLPAFRFQKYLPSKLAQLRHLSGANSARLVSKGSEFESLREYVPGDDVRDIEWHATGRQGKAVVKTWRPQTGQQILICVDSSRLGATRLEDYPRFDTHLESALMLGALIGGGQDKASLIAFDSRVRKEVFSVRGSQILPRFADLLSDVHPVLSETNWSALCSRIEQLRFPHALVVICTALESSPTPQFNYAVSLLGRKNKVLIANVTDPLVQDLAGRDVTDIKDAYSTVSSLVSLEKNDGYIRQVQALGASVISAPPSQMPLALADKYLELKRAGQF